VPQRAGIGPCTQPGNTRGGQRKTWTLSSTAISDPSTPCVGSPRQNWTRDPLGEEGDRSATTPPNRSHLLEFYGGRGALPSSGTIHASRAIFDTTSTPPPTRHSEPRGGYATSRWHDSIVRVWDAKYTSGRHARSMVDPAITTGVSSLRTIRVHPSAHSFLAGSSTTGPWTVLFPMTREFGPHSPDQAGRGTDHAGILSPHRPRRRSGDRTSGGNVI